MPSLIAAIRSAVRPGAITDSAIDDDGKPDAAASTDELPLDEAQTTGGDMSAENQTATGAAPAASATPAAGAAAPEGGSADGHKAAMDKTREVLSAEGIKGDPARMNAAVDLMGAAPDMAASAIVSYVTANVPAAAGNASASAEAATTYEQRRTSAAAGLAQPAGDGGARVAEASALNPSAIYAARRNATK